MKLLEACCTLIQQVSLRKLAVDTQSEMCLSSIFLCTHSKLANAALAVLYVYTICVIVWSPVVLRLIDFHVVHLQMAHCVHQMTRREYPQPGLPSSATQVTDQRLTFENLAAAWASASSERSQVQRETKSAQ